MTDDARSTNDAPVLLREGLDGIAASLLEGMLETQGIPSLRKNPDFDVAELGIAAHDMVRGVSIFVPASAFERAEAIAREAFDAEPAESDEA